MGMDLEREKKLLEAQVKDANNRVDDAEQNALKCGKKAVGKMETRIHQLEFELEAETRRLADAQKNLRKSERMVSELSYERDEDLRNTERMQALIDQQQAKIRTFKKQIEEAEEISAVNLAKYRTVAASLATAWEVAEHREQDLARHRVRARSQSVLSL